MDVPRSSTRFELRGATQPKEAPVTISTTCKGCGVELVAEDEDALVGVVQSHLAEAHASGHRPSREQVLSVIRARASRES